MLHCGKAGIPHDSPALFGSQYEHIWLQGGHAHAQTNTAPSKLYSQKYPTAHHVQLIHSDNDPK